MKPLLLSKIPRIREVLFVRHYLFDLRLPFAGKKRIDCAERDSNPLSHVGLSRSDDEVVVAAAAAGGVRPFFTAHFLTPPRSTPDDGAARWLVRIAKKAAAHAVLVARVPRVRSIKRLLATTSAYVRARVRGTTQCVDDDVLRTGVHNVPRVPSTHG